MRVIALIDSFRDCHRIQCNKPRGARFARNVAVMCAREHIAAGFEHMLLTMLATVR
jgi:hypothetical protein